MQNSNNVSIKELKANLNRIDDLMKRGIHKEPKTGKEFFTGYVDSTLFDWDQYFEAIIQLYLGWGSEYIKNGVEIFLDNQEDNGFIARSVRVKPFGPELDEMVKPFLAQITLLVYKKDMHISWLNEKYYNKLKKYLIHWLVDKDKNKNSLSVWNSGPHTGMDNQHERAGYWNDLISEGIDLNCYLYRECLAFAKIAEILGKKNDTKTFEDYAKKIKNAIQNNLWDEKDGFFYDLNEKTGKLMKVKSVAAFSALWSGIATKEQADRLVKEHLLNPKEFLRPFPIPALSADEEGYVYGYMPNDVGCSWRAHTWIPTNYYVYHGLKNYGYNIEAKTLANKTYEVVLKSGDHEYYSSEDSKGCGQNPFWGWSLLGYFMPIEDKLNYDPTILDTDISDSIILWNSNK